MPHLEETLDYRSSDQALKEAEIAASRGDPHGMVEAIYRSGYLMGLTRAMCRKWDSLSADDSEQAVADAVSDLYFAVSEGQQVWNIKSWLWKVADTILLQYWSRREATQESVPDDLVYLNSIPGDSSEEDESGIIKFDPYELDPQERRSVALRVARSLISKLGQQNVQWTMKYIFDALEKGCEDVPAEEICTALGYNNVVTVRQWISRGFKRLGARARQEGIINDSFDPTRWVSDAKESQAQLGGKNEE